MDALPRRFQAFLQFTQRILAGADHDVVHGQHLRLAAVTDTDVQAFVVDLQVLNTVEHLHLLVLQSRAVNPAGGLAQAVTDLGGLALQQEYLPRRRMGLGLDPGHAAACLESGVDPPLLPERLAVLTGGYALVHQELRHVEADTTGPDHRHAAAHRLALQKHVQVAQHLGMFHPGNRRQPRRDPRGEDNLVVTASHQLFHIYTGVETQLDMSGLQFALEITQGFEELLFARHSFSDVELATDLAGRIKQRHLVPALGRHRGRGQPGRTGANHGNFLHLSNWQIVEFGFMARPRVHQATGELAAEGMVEAGLVAANAGIDFIRPASGSLVDEIRIRQERSRHGNHIGVTVSEDLLSHFRRIDTIGGDQGNTYRTAQLGRDLAERRPGNLGGNGGNACLMPADTGVDDRRAGLFDGLGQLDDFLPGAAALHQVEHRQAKNDDEVRSYRLAHPSYDFHRQAHAVLIAAAPTVGPVVGVGRQELVNEIPFRAHDLDAIVFSLPGQHRARDEVTDLFLDPFLIQFLGLERIDRCLDRARRYLLGAVGVASGMENLHADLATGLVNGPGNDPVLERFFLGGQLGGAGVHAALVIRSDPARHHQAHTATGTLGKICRHTLETTGLFLEARVHRPHQGTVAQRGKTQVQRGQQMRVMRGGHW